MTSLGAGPESSAFNLRWGWQDFMAIYGKDNYGQVPLMELQCPFCGRGTPFTPAKSKTVNDTWQSDFVITDHATHAPHGPAFDPGTEIHARAYGHVTLRCLGCSNAFYVMYVMSRDEGNEGQLPIMQFWQRLTVPNTPAAASMTVKVEEVTTTGIGFHVLPSASTHQDAIERPESRFQTTLEKLTSDANSEDQGVRKSVADDPECPLELLILLSQDKECRVRQAVARHPHCPLEVLRLLARDEDWEVREDVARHMNCPPEVLFLLSYDEEWEVREPVARHPNCPLEVLWHLADDGDRDVMCAVALHPLSSADVLERVWHSGGEDVAGEILGHAACPSSLQVEIFETLADSSDCENVLGTAEDPLCPPHVLRILAEVDDRNHYADAIRDAVASHPNSPAEALAYLANDESGAVRVRVAQHVNCPTDVLVTLANDEEIDVLIAVSERPELAVRRAVARNPISPDSVLQVLSADPDPEVQRCLLERRSQLACR